MLLMSAAGPESNRELSAAFSACKSRLKRNVSETALVTTYAHIRRRTKLQETGPKTQLNNRRTLGPRKLTLAAVCVPPKGSSLLARKGHGCLSMSNANRARASFRRRGKKRFFLRSRRLGLYLALPSATVRCRTRRPDRVLLFCLKGRCFERKTSPACVPAVRV